MDDNVIKVCEAALLVGKPMSSVNQRIGVLMHKSSVLIQGNEPHMTRTSWVEWLDNTACCAGLRARGYGGIGTGVSGVEAIVSVSQTERGPAMNRADSILLYDILINHTPYGKCVAKKDPAYAYDFGLIINADYPSNLIAGCLMAQRLAWEYTDVARNILHYAELGVDKGVAFLLGHTFSTSGATTRNSGHCCIDSAFISESFIKNFVNGVAQHDVAYSVQKNYKFNVHNTFQTTRAEPDKWSNCHSECEGVHISKVIAEYAKGQSATVALPNPFAKSFTLEANKITDQVIVSYFKEHSEYVVPVPVAPMFDVIEDDFDDEDDDEDDW